MSKRVIEKELKGAILKPCPGTKNYLCCGYWVLHLGENCPFGCNYCILRSYYEHREIVVFKRDPQTLSALALTLAQNQDKTFRIGTGEFTDSLALKELEGWNRDLIHLIQGTENSLLELKTKSTNIKWLLGLKNRHNLVISWSLNSPYVWEREEKGTPSVQKRVEAARLLQSEGFVIGIHFDPIFEYKGWQRDYMVTLELLTKLLDPAKIIWISLGVIRFMPELLDFVRKASRESLLLKGEYVMGLDGKFRVFKPIRIELFSFFVEVLRSWHRELCIYLCMESEDVWRYSLGWAPRDSRSLSDFLDQRKRLFFGPEGQP